MRRCSFILLLAAALPCGGTVTAQIVDLDQETASCLRAAISMETARALLRRCNLPWVEKEIVVPAGTNERACLYFRYPCDAGERDDVTVIVYDKASNRIARIASVFSPKTKHCVMSEARLAEAEIWIDDKRVYVFEWGAIHVLRGSEESGRAAQAVPPSRRAWRRSRRKGSVRFRPTAVVASRRKTFP